MDFKKKIVRNRVINHELDDDYLLIYKDIDNILDDIDFVTEDDRVLCRSIVDSLEKEAAAQLLAGQCVQLPYIGNIRRSPIKMAMISHYKEFKEKRSELSREEYVAYCKGVMKKEKMKIQNMEIHKRKMNVFKKKYLKLWMDKRKQFGDAYANLYLLCYRNWTVVEFDWDVEIAYQESNNYHG